MFICLLYVLENEGKTLKPCTLPTMILPQKSVETPKFPEIRQLIKTTTESKKTHFHCKNFPDFTRQIFKKKLEKSGK